MDETGYVIVSDRATTEDFESFFARNRDGLFAALWLISRDRHEAEELSQDALAKVWERWSSVRGMENPDGYLYRTAMNLLRNRRRRATLALRRMVGVAPDRDELREVDDRDELLRALSALTERERAALVLTDLLGSTSEEAAHALGVRSSTVRVLASRGRAKLRDQIGEVDE